MCMHYKTNVLMHTMGDDFTYIFALKEFKQIDKIINYINSNGQSNIKFKYSTPEDYIEELAAASENVEYPLKTDDFFPYADKPNAYWSGYFTSRPALKGYIRELGRYI